MIKDFVVVVQHKISNEQRKLIVGAKSLANVKSVVRTSSGEAWKVISAQPA